MSVVQLSLPPLRERKDEIPLLIAYFCDEAAAHLGRSPLKMTSRLRDFLLKYPYPGNIRELRNLIFSLSCLAEERADLEHLPESIQPEPPTEKEQPVAAKIQSLNERRKAASDAAEKQYLEEALKHNGGKVVELARGLGLNRSHLQTLLKKHGIRSRDFRPSEPSKEDD